MDDIRFHASMGHQAATGSLIRHGDERPGA